MKTCEFTQNTSHVKKKKKSIAGANQHRLYNKELQSKIICKSDSCSGIMCYMIIGMIC